MSTHTYFICHQFPTVEVQIQARMILEAKSPVSFGIDLLKYSALLKMSSYV